MVFYLTMECTPGEDVEEVYDHMVHNANSGRLQGIHLKIVSFSFYYMVKVKWNFEWSVTILALSPPFGAKDCSQPYNDWMLRKSSMDSTR